MARIKMNIPDGVEVKNRDVEFHVSKANKKLGTLKVSKGTIEWLPAYAQRGYGYQLSWERFAQVMKKEIDE